MKKAPREGARPSGGGTWDSETLVEDELRMINDNSKLREGPTCCGNKAWLYPEMPWGAPPECDTNSMRGVSAYLSSVFPAML